MAKYNQIMRKDKTISIVRCELENATEDPLTEHEKIIHELVVQIQTLCKIICTGE